jgi:DNA primase
MMTAEQTEALLEECRVEVVTDTFTHFLCLCPWHGNTETPALAVDKVRGVYHCFNPSCDRSGTLETMIETLLHKNIFQAKRMIATYKNNNFKPVNKRLEEAMMIEPDFVEFSQAALDKLKADFPGSIAQDYMRGRGFEDETLDYFDVGYSGKKNMVTVPMHDPKGMPVGLIGRTPSATDKRFKNSVGLPKAKTAWNFHRAKRHGDTIIVCEASYDAMRIHQSGYPNVIALLGGSVTEHHAAQIARNFARIILMTDFDKKQYKPNCRACNYEVCRGHRPGRDLGRAIIKAVPNKQVLWASYDDEFVYPRGVKDASDMTDAEIRTCLKNAIPNLTYIEWNIEETIDEKLLAV